MYRLRGGAFDVDGPAAVPLAAPVMMNAPAPSGPEAELLSESVNTSTHGIAAGSLPTALVSLRSASSSAAIRLASSVASLATSSTLGPAPCPQAEADLQQRDWDQGISRRQKEKCRNKDFSNKGLTRGFFLRRGILSPSKICCVHLGTGDIVCQHALSADRLIGRSPCRRAPSVRELPPGARTPPAVGWRRRRWRARLHSSTDAEA